MVGAHCPSFDIIPCLGGERHHLCGGSPALQCKCLSEGSRCKHIGRWGDIIRGPGAWSLAHWHYQDTRHDVIIHHRIIIILALLDHSVGDESHHLAHPKFTKIAINDRKSLKLYKSFKFFVLSFYPRWFKEWDETRQPLRLIQTLQPLYTLWIWFVICIHNSWIFVLDTLEVYCYWIVKLCSGPVQVKSLGPAQNSKNWTQAIHYN